MSFRIPNTVEDVKSTYVDDQPLQLIDREVAEEAKKVLEQAGYKIGATAIDVAIHDEDIFPVVETVVGHHGSPKRLMDAGAVIGPCFLKTKENGISHERFFKKGIGFWIPRRGL